VISVIFDVDSTTLKCRATALVDFAEEEDDAAAESSLLILLLLISLLLLLSSYTTKPPASTFSEANGCLSLTHEGYHLQSQSAILA
jgi:hypothetical protein